MRQVGSYSRITLSADCSNVGTHHRSRGSLSGRLRPPTLPTAFALVLPLAAVSVGLGLRSGRGSAAWPGSRPDALAARRPVPAAIGGDGRPGSALIRRFPPFTSSDRVGE